MNASGVVISNEDFAVMGCAYMGVVLATGNASRMIGYVSPGHYILVLGLYGATFAHRCSLISPLFRVLY